MSQQETFRYRRCSFRTVALVFAFSFGLLQALVAEAPEPRHGLRVLLTYGGHHFDEKAFFNLFDQIEGVEYDRAPMPESAKLLKPGLEEDYDVIVMFDMVRTIGVEEREQFLSLLKTGIGVVSLHHNLGAHRDWDEFRKVIGGRWLFADAEVEGKLWKASTYLHDQDYEVKIVDPDHPITKGLKNFKIQDEVYQGTFTAEGVQVLLTTEHPKSDHEIAWTTRYGNSPVFYLKLGDQHTAWKNPSFQIILNNAIRWAHSNVRDPRVEKSGEALKLW